MAFSVRFDTDNAAFERSEDDESGYRAECARILREIAGTVESGSDGSGIYDVNGNRVGVWHLAD